MNFNLLTNWTEGFSKYKRDRKAVANVETSELPDTGNWSSRLVDTSLDLMLADTERKARVESEEKEAAMGAWSEDGNARRKEQTEDLV